MGGRAKRKMSGRILFSEKKPTWKKGGEETDGIKVKRGGVGGGGGKEMKEKVKKSTQL